MSAETLREAAALMRERAKVATPSADPEPGGWRGFAVDDDGRAAIYGGPSENGYRTATVLEFKEHTDCEECARPSVEDVEHIASWHPAVALAVADWLDETAGWASRAESENSPTVRSALAVAAAYLGRNP